MSKLRSVNTQFWSDPWVEELTPSEKLLYLYFITNEKTNMLGVYEMSIRKISFDTGINSDTIKKALESFERIGKVKYTKNYIVLLNFAKHQNYNTNMKKSAIDVFNNLPKELINSDIKVSKDKPLEGFERVLKALGMVRKVEVEVESETKGEREGEEENNSDLIRSIKEIEKDYLKNDRLIEAVLTGRDSPFTDRSDLEKKLSEFCEHLRSIDETAKSEKDFKRHFLNWSRKKKEKDSVQKEKPKRHKLSMNDLHITKEDLEFKNLNQ